SITSGEPVYSETSVTGTSAPRSERAVPPVERIVTPRSTSARARSITPRLSETEIKAVRMLVTRSSSSSGRLPVPSTASLARGQRHRVGLACSRAASGRGQHDLEGGAAAEGAPHADLAAVRLDQALGDRQAQAGPRSPPAAPEAIEEPR